MSKILSAKDIKPNFEKVKQVWSDMLSNYYDNNGELKKEYIVEVNCPYCQKSSTNNEFKINGFKHVTCKNCDTVYVSPRLKNEFIDKLYSEEYYSEMFINSMIPVFDKRKELIGKRKFNQVTEFSKSGGSVLDIGCGIGEVIDVFKDNDWDCHAIEFNPGAVKWLKNKKINVSTIPFDKYKSNIEFDVIMAWGVVEHVLNPKLFLDKVYELLKPGGIFVSEVPHGNSFLVDYVRVSEVDPYRIIMGEQHIVLYSIEAYKNLHLDAGLKNLHLQTNGLDFSTILEVTNSSLDNNLISNVQKIIDEKLYGDLLRGFWVKK
tara:strand:+ start:2666 stop:3619 length:954 start_codon:yes stop_codon:yes gene_type:complete